MTRFLLFLFSAYLLSLSPAQAAVISRDWKTPGDGLLTYDTINQREWLDLTETILSQFPGANLDAKVLNVLTELQTGGKFKGFVAANGLDITALVQSAGIDTTTLDFSTNHAMVENLIDLLGATHNESSSVSSWGAILGGMGGRNETRTALITLEGSSEAGIKFIQVDRIDYGVWLYRQIPEPATGILILSVILIVCATRQKF